MNTWKELTEPQEQCKIYCKKCGGKWRSEEGWYYDDSQEAIHANKQALQSSGLMMLAAEFQKFRYMCDSCSITKSGRAVASSQLVGCKSCGQTDHSRKTSKKCLHYVPKVKPAS